MWMTATLKWTTLPEPDELVMSPMVYETARTIQFSRLAIFRMLRFESQLLLGAAWGSSVAINA